jgi:hypothetical protein
MGFLPDPEKHTIVKYSIMMSHTPSNDRVTQHSQQTPKWKRTQYGIPARPWKHTIVTYSIMIAVQPKTIVIAEQPRRILSLPDYGYVLSEKCSSYDNSPIVF